MFDIGWSELLLIGVVALIVVGPKDLPVMFHTLGRLTAKARQMAREFSRAMEDAAKETGINDVASDLKGIASKKSLGLEALERATEKFEKWDPKLPGTAKAAAPAALQPDPELAAELDAAEAEYEPGDAPEPGMTTADTAAAAPAAPAGDAEKGKA
ncbi:Sec-independent protein translocase protein TatB [Sinirhodobacter huangdaonensis]|uniref:Twin-arginine translocase subunit TatB n=1 Tax=Paenirhodobacter huangdaonensis TaxID=2501515 RepID=A0A443LXM2_9RHOB|nr:Sec-independent protein translocase protein TatB [Sinirhodobacter huangdaonensis]RWR53866.1 twin-arginine translocase subunit TatB [Sinirhodobacter huangdaonensis]